MDSSFNEHTGFKVINSALGEGMRIVPSRYSSGHQDHEGGLGYLGSGVWVRKTRDVNLEWPVDPETIYSELSRFYPKEITD